MSRTGGLQEYGPPYRGPTGRFGVHLTLDGYRGNPERLADINLVHAWLDELPEMLGMNKLIEPCLIEVGALSDKDPGGVTGFVLIAQSHLSVHTFPRRRFVSADIYTCQDHLDHGRISQSLIATFGLGDVEINLISRGTRYPLVNLVDEGPTGATVSRLRPWKDQL
jgi:S-adenosylmethionine decarboxylase